MLSMSFPEWLTPQFAYLVFSAIVAVLIWIEGGMLKRNNGKLPKSAFFQICSLIDTAWFFVSTVTLYMLDFTPLVIVVPAAYGIYTVFGWIYGTRLLKRHGIPDSPDGLIVPSKYIAYSQSFALIFFLLCILVIVQSQFAITI